MTVNGVDVFVGTLPSAPSAENPFSVPLNLLAAGSDLTATLRCNSIGSNDPKGLLVDSVCKDSYGCTFLRKQSIPIPPVLFCCSLC